MKKKKKTLDNIRDHIEKHEHKPFMISEIADKIEVTFDTTKDHLLHLAAIGFLDMRKIGRHWIFWKKPREEAEIPHSTSW